MKRVFLVLLLTGCAQGLTPQQREIWTYFLDQCQREGVADENLKACLTTKLVQADAQWRASGGGSNVGNVMQGMGQAITPQRPAMQCESYRDMAGVTRTTCR